MGLWFHVKRDRHQACGYARGFRLLGIPIGGLAGRFRLGIRRARMTGELIPIVDWPAAVLSPRILAFGASCEEAGERSAVLLEGVDL
jgi:hypothetical protein